MDTASNRSSWRRIAVALGAAASIAIPLLAVPLHAQTTPVAAESLPAIDPAAYSCKALKDLLEKSGSRTLTPGPRGWGDTYYGRVPQCEFWQRPVFAYVNTSDGQCGVGYICVAKVSSN